jgi:prolycopene isomerase
MKRGYDALVIGAGISGLTAAALLAKRGLRVHVLERNRQPGGSCGAFRRLGYTLDLGAAMLFGFGEGGFNPHRFVMNELEEPLDVYRHRAMYRLHCGDESIVFWPEPERFFAELKKLFPDSIRELTLFYRDLEKLYGTVTSASTLFLSPAETPQRELLAGLLKHPVLQFRLLRLLSKNTMFLMKKRVKDQKIVRFFNKLTSTYTYTTIEETPALLAVTMFVENHVGGTYYPAGSPMMLAAKLEKALEKCGGTIQYGATAAGILVDRDRAVGAALETGEEFFAEHVVFSGTVWNLYEKLIPAELVPLGIREKTRALEPSFPSSVLYGAVKESAIPKDAFPVEMLIGNPEEIDESDVTLYLSSLEDPTLAAPGTHAFMLIGPSRRQWPAPDSKEYGSEEYTRMKEEESRRMLELVERRFPGFRENLIFHELGSPSTIERYLLKKGGAVAGPKQCMGQELLNRQHAVTFLPGLVACGESTVMGTGTPAVTISGISAADVVLRSRGLPEYRNRTFDTQFVRIIPTGQEGNRQADPAFRSAALCQWCEDIPCQKACPSGIDIMGIMRRIEADNIAGAHKRLLDTDTRYFGCASCPGTPCLGVCKRTSFAGAPVPIPALLTALNAAPNPGR